MMTKAQMSLYWRLWSGAKKALITRGLTPKAADAERHALHIRALGEDKSSTRFTNADFDKIIGVFRAEAEPANLHAQLRQIEQPRTRNLATLDTCLAVLGETRDYAQSILVQMNREGALEAREIQLDDLTEAQFDRLHIALKKACRRKWPTKDHILAAVTDFAREFDLEEAAAADAVCTALHRERVIPQKLTYEQLLVALAALKKLAGQVVEEPF